MAELESKLKSSIIPWHVIILLMVVLILRGPTLGLSVIDWDETAYALVAREILSGHWPFSVTFDHKPAALYYHFAAVIAVFGDNPTSSRLVGLFLVVGSTFILRSLLVKRVGLSANTGTIFTLFFILASSGIGGATSNSEHVVNFYVLAWMWAIYKALDGRSVYYLLAGIFMGIAFQSNYLAGFIMVGFSAGFIARSLFGEGAFYEIFIKVIKAGSIALIGFVFINVLVLLPIWLWGNLTEYFTIQFDYLDGYGPVEGAFWASRDTLKLFIPLLFIMAFCIYVSLIYPIKGVLHL